jgi:hypothetical protein
VLFIGDSTSQQVAAAVHNYVVVGGGGCSAQISSAESDTLMPGAPRGTPSWTEAVRAAPQRPHVAVLGVGPHVHSGEAGFRQILAAVREDLASHADLAGLHIAWRTSSGGGCLVAGQPLVPRTVWPRDEPGYWEALALRQPIWNYDQMERWDLIAAEFWRGHPRVSLLDLTPLWLRPDAMVDSGREQVVDCVHSCVPGALRLAARQLMHLLHYAIPLTDATPPH